jgi:hypothetical protein
MILGIRAVAELSDRSGGLDKNDGFLLPNGKVSVHVDSCRNCIALVSGRAMLRVMRSWIPGLTGAALLAGCAHRPLNRPKMGSSRPLNMPYRASSNLTLHGELEQAQRGTDTATGDALSRPIDDQVNIANERHYELNGSNADIDRCRRRRSTDGGIIAQEAHLTSIVDSYSCWQVAVINDTLQSITSL